jgi:hypothetical protein
MRLGYVAAAVAVLAIGMGVQQAQATPSVELGSATGTWTNVVGGAHVNYDNNFGYESVYWGDPSSGGLHWWNQSGLGFKGSQNLGITPGNPFSIGTLAHQNNPIENGTAITSADLEIDMTFSAPPGMFSETTLSLGVNETPTVVTGYKKVWILWPFIYIWVPIKHNPADIVTIGGIDSSVVIDEYKYDGYKYSLKILGAHDGKNWVTELETKEHKVSYVDLIGVVEVMEMGPEIGGEGDAVPEPATAGLGLLGIAGLLVATRRRRAA